MHKTCVLYLHTKNGFKLKLFEIRSRMTYGYSKMEARIQIEHNLKCYRLEIFFLFKYLWYHKLQIRCIIFTYYYYTKDLFE